MSRTVLCVHVRRRRLDRASAARECRARAARRDLGAALISAVITVTILAVLLLVFSKPARLSGLAGFKPHYAIGGIGGAAVVAVSLVACVRSASRASCRCWSPVSW